MRTMYLDISVPRILLTRVLGRISRAAYFAPTSPLHRVSLPDPPLPAPDWVRVRNRLCGICGSDLHQIFVDAGLDVAPVALPSHRRIYLGYEMVGEVAETSAAVREFSLGDRVLREHASEPREHHPVGGGFGDSFITPASTLLPVPAALTDEQAVLVEPAAVAIHAASRRPARPGERVLVLGAGIIGFLLIQVVKAFEPRCEITAVAQFPWQAELAARQGAQHVFLSGDDGFAEVARLTGARVYAGRAGNRMLMGGFDVIFDVVGTGATLNPALRWARADGTVVLVGVNLHRMRLDVTPVWYQEVNLIGSVGHGVVTWRGEEVSTFDLAMRWMLDGTLATDGLVTHRFPLAAYREAFAAAVDKHIHRSVKVAFDLTR